MLYLLVSRGLFPKPGTRIVHSYDYQPDGGIRASKGYAYYLQQEMLPARKGEDHNGTSQ